MAATVELDNVEGAAASHKLNEGWAITRTALVRDLSVAANTGALLQAAEAAVIAVVGDRGSSCPGITVATYLDDMIPELVSATIVRFRLVYKGYPRVTYEFDGTLSTVQSNKDINGNLLKLQYKYPAAYTLDPTGKAGKVKTQGVFYPRQVPRANVTVRFPIFDGFMVNGVAQSARNAASWFASFQGTINNDQYTLGIITGSVHQWMITRVRAVSSDGEASFVIQMTFEYRQETWDPYVVFINPDDGLPPADLLGPTDSFPSGQTAPGYNTVRGAIEVTFPVVYVAPN
jgi:hypothetical protein